MNEDRAPDGMAMQGLAGIFGVCMELALTGGQDVKFDLATRSGVPDDELLIVRSRGHTFALRQPDVLIVADLMARTGASQEWVQYIRELADFPTLITNPMVKH